MVYASPKLLGNKEIITHYPSDIIKQNPLDMPIGLDPVRHNSKILKNYSIFKINA